MQEKKTFAFYHKQRRTEWFFSKLKTVVKINKQRSSDLEWSTSFASQMTKFEVASLTKKKKRRQARKERRKKCIYTHTYNVDHLMIYVIVILHIHNQCQPAKMTHTHIETKNGEEEKKKKTRIEIKIETRANGMPAVPVFISTSSQ